MLQRIIWIGLIHPISVNEPKTNPAFAGWTFVYARYCDGSSFSGRRIVPIQVEQISQIEIETKDTNNVPHNNYHHCCIFVEIIFLRR